jgi:predicted metal-binding membrane protein
MRFPAAIARRPTLWVEAGITAVWGLLLALALWPGGAAAAASGPRAQGPLFVCMTEMAGMGAGVATRAGHVAAAGAFMPLTGALPMLALMATAMMLPPALPAVGYVAVNSFYWRRRRAVVEFVIVFLAIWVAYNAAVLAVVGATHLAASPIVPVATLGLAALWQLTPAKRRALQACHRTRALPPKGWRATAGVADFGLRNAGACVASCWAMMLTTAFVGLPSVLWMAVLTGLITAERFSSRPGRASRRVAATLGLAAIAAAALALL